MHLVGTARTRLRVASEYYPYKLMIIRHARRGFNRGLAVLRNKHILSHDVAMVHQPTTIYIIVGHY